jgi:hypothetical protein
MMEPAAGVSGASATARCGGRGLSADTATDTDKDTDKVHHYYSPFLIVG